MTNLDRVITEIQREAADTSTQDLRSDIEVGLDVLDAAIGDLHALRPEADVIARISATWGLLGNWSTSTALSSTSGSKSSV